MLAVQAILEDLPLITSDPACRQFDGLRIEW